MKKIFIAGAGGYLGVTLTKHLLKNNYKVIALDRFFFGDTLINLENNKNLTIIRDDIRYFNIKHLKGVDVVVNLAAITGDAASDLDHKATKQINYLGAKRIARLSKKMNVSKYIFASTCSVYGSIGGDVDEESNLVPASEYARSKIQAEKALIKLADKSFNVLVYRFSTLYGLNIERMKFDLMVNIMTLHAWKNNKVFVFGGGSQWRPLLHITDASIAIEKGITLKKTNDNYNIINIGSNDQNYQAKQIAYGLRNHFPNLEIEITPDGPDPRNYIVYFNKAKKFLNFKPKKNVNDAIIEIKRELEKGTIKDEIITSTHTYYKYLMEADIILQKVKIGKKLL